MGSVAVLASSNTDLVCQADRLPRPGETVGGSAFAIFGGGKGANQAVAAARAGASVRLAGCTGDDDFGAARRADLIAEGIETALLRVVPGVPSGVALIVVDAHGENQIVYVAGANAHVSPEDATALLAAPCAVLSLTLEVPVGAVAAALDLRPAGTLAILNAAPLLPETTELLRQVDVLVINEVEAAELLGRPVSATGALQAAADLRGFGCEAAIITLGADGCVVATGDAALAIPAPRVDAVDTTGAGDAFCGTLAAWIAAGAGLPSAARAGVAAGALAVTRSGAQPSLPYRDEIVALLERGW